MTKITILIPCYNEAKTIEKIVSKVIKSEISEKEIIIIDDCSSDGTKEILKSKISPLVNKIIYHETNLGKGACIRTGIKYNNQNQGISCFSNYKETLCTQAVLCYDNK